MLAFISTAALSVLVPALAALASGNVPLTKYAGPIKPNSYIDNVSKDAHLSSVISGFIAGSSLQYKYGDIFHGYAINLHGQDLALLRRSKDIEYVIEDGIATIDYLPEDNLDVSRKSQAVFESLSAQVTGGEGVDVYGIDTGIYTNHSCFGGRASWGATYGGYADADGNGHGTHTAGTAVGEKYGQAPRAKIIAVKVLSDYGFGAWSDIISGVAFAVAGMQASGRPSISTMSIGGSQFTPVDTAIRNGIAQGMHYTVAAGNSNVDAATTSPAGVAEAVTVGAVDYNNTKAWFSNYGPIVDVQAPGVDVLSAWIGSPNATNIISGTSMATPFVAGILAVAISEYGNKSPANLSADLISYARPICTGEPNGTTNLLATLW